MKPYLIIKTYENINSMHLHQAVNDKQDALTLCSILQQNEEQRGVKYYVFGVMDVEHEQAQLDRADDYASREY